MNDNDGIDVGAMIADAGVLANARRIINEVTRIAGGAEGRPAQVDPEEAAKLLLFTAALIIDATPNMEDDQDIEIATTSCAGLLQTLLTALAIFKTKEGKPLLMVMQSAKL